MLDTNVCLDFLLGRSMSVRDRIGQAYGALTVSAVTAAELRVGSRRSRDPTRDARTVDRFLSHVQVAAFDNAAADAYGVMTQDIGMARNSFDRLIAAHARALDVILVTSNLRDFARYPGLRLENWREADAT